ncbi:hypothetical protein B0I35DRAFT_277632 [Stachybotrys elegans]|uniref:Uncharacterized protein n=1 Tax=Stachybotrys elegans TaxID=80388 RepID=A0A8K0SM94_9HYPO|nr:hypothetical protein B0I35DRAFT_277632 [Stachybotrys elegans]
MVNARVDEEQRAQRTAHLTVLGDVALSTDWQKQKKDQTCGVKLGGKALYFIAPVQLTTAEQPYSWPSAQGLSPCHAMPLLASHFGVPECGCAQLVSIAASSAVHRLCLGTLHRESIHDRRHPESRTRHTAYFKLKASGRWRLFNTISTALRRSQRSATYFSQPQGASLAFLDQPLAANAKVSLWLPDTIHVPHGRHFAQFGLAWDLARGLGFLG